MKELSIEEKARRYDEALKEAVIAHKDEDKHLKATLERIFPELKVSNEQVAQKLHKLLCSEVTCEQFEKHGLTVDSALYWLEKQQKALKVEEAMRDVEQKAKAFTKAHAGETSDEILAQMRGEGWSENESEYEKIRKEIMYHIQYCDDTIDKETEERMIAWLEKQGEQETDEWKEGNIIRHGGILALVIKGRRVMKSNGEIFAVQYPNEWVKAVPNEIEYFLNELEKQGEQKPAWSEEDVAMLDSAIAFVSHSPFTVIGKGKSNVIAWLKSLKDRYTWKPSEEQIKALNEVLNFAANHESSHWNDYIFGTLNNLIRQLKKLKG